MGLMGSSSSSGGDCMPFMVMVFVQVCYAGLNITSKLAMESGMNPLVLVAYRQIFATIAIAPFGYWMERYIHILLLCVRKFLVSLLENITPRKSRNGFSFLRKLAIFFNFFSWPEWIMIDDIIHYYYF